eukprot:gene22342-28932_t
MSIYKVDDAREYIQDIQRVSELGDRPFTAPGPLDIDTTQIDVNFHSNHLIDSPYDEQVVITDINSDIETVDYQTILPKPSKELSSEIRLQSSNNSYKSPNKRSNSVSRKRSNSLSNSGVNSKEELKAKEEKSKQDKLLRGKEAYNKWLKRNKKNKYYSKIDNSLRPLPTARVVEHRTGWRQENDLTNHYAKVDRTM